MKNPHSFFRKPQKKESVKSSALIFPKGQNYVDVELSDDEIKKYKNDGYVVKDISIPTLNTMDKGGEPELEQDLQEQVVYGNEAKRKLQGSLIDKYNQAKGAYQDYRENAGLTKQRLKNEGASSIGVLQGQIKEYKNQLEEEKKAYDRAQKALNVLQKKDSANWKDKKLKDVMSSQGVDALRDLYSKGEMSDASFRDFYDNFGKQYDREAAKTTAEDQVKLEDSWYGKKDEEGRRRWMSNPMNVAKVAQGVAIAAPLAPFAPAVLANPLVQAGLTGYGVYDATTNTLPAAYRNYQQGQYAEMAGNLGMAALDLAPIPLVGTNLLDDALDAGKYLTTQTPLKDAYKLNPWAFKPNPNSAYRMIGDEKGLASAIESGYLQPTTTGSDIGKVHNAAHYQIGAPSDTREYFGRTWSRGYKGPYMAEVPNATTDVRFAQGPGGKEMGSDVWTYPDNYIPSSEAKLYKQDWLRGYKEIPKPTSSVDDVNKGFKSEIDWAKWNKEIPENKALMQEYNAIEQQTKANDTWMKNPDGSSFQGTPEQFVQQNSENFKKAFPNAVKNELENSLFQYHGTGSNFNKFKDKKYKSIGRLLGDGIYTTPSKESASIYAKFKKNPRVLELYQNANKPQLEGTVLDPVNYDYLINKSNPLAEQVVPFTNYPKSAIGNNGMFDMTNPNIYKSVLPYAVPVGLGAGALTQEKKYGGAIEKELTDEEIKWYKSKGYIVEEID
jgi:hypothetical protein